MGRVPERDEDPITLKEACGCVPGYRNAGDVAGGSRPRQT